MAQTFESKVRNIGRILQVCAICLVMLAGLSSSSPDRLEPYMPDPHSVALVAAAIAAQQSGRPDDAVDYYVSALAIDPRNSDAYVGLGDVANARDTPGVALHYYRTARLLSPDDEAAISGQGAAYAARAALPGPKSVD